MVVIHHVLTSLHPTLCRILERMSVCGIYELEHQKQLEERPVIYMCVVYLN